MKMITEKTKKEKDIPTYQSTTIKFKKLVLAQMWPGYSTNFSFQNHFL
jgi:hypothetical protein